MNENYNNMESIMRYEAEKHLGCVTQESEYIKIWVINSGRTLARVLCGDKLSLLRICGGRRKVSK